MIYHIQRYSLHDGSGLRTTVFLKGCALRCTWCSNPESHSFTKELSWNESLCIQCGDCTLVDPNGAMQWVNNKIHFFPELQSDVESYREVCPSKALEVIGHESSAKQILSEIMKDRVFYRENGGVTLSGGEPLTQPELCLEIAQGLKKEGLRLAIETCLNVPWSGIEMVAPLVDEFLCDIKHVTSQVFRQQTEGNLDLVWDNLSKLNDIGVPIRARIPIIEGFNKDEEVVRQIIQRLEPMSSVYAVDFMPYHPFGAGKYQNLGRQYSHPLKAMTDEEVAPFFALVNSERFVKTIGG